MMKNRKEEIDTKNDIKKATTEKNAVKFFFKQLER